VRLVALALTIAISTTIACRRVEGEPRPAQSATPATASVEPREPREPRDPSEPREPSRPSIGFHSSRQLSEHFEKHGPEFGSITRSEYLSRAQHLRDAPLGGNILEMVRADGVITRFDRTTGAFIAFGTDRTIRTFFRPNDGEAYFRRQARR
jgi:pyocin large subunit-like protein